MRELGFGDSILKQEGSCGALGDVITARFLAPVTGNALMSKIAAAARHMHTAPNGAVPCIRILDIRLIPHDSPLSAEACCTHRTYHYMLPLSAIDPNWRLPESTMETGTPAYARLILSRGNEHVRTQGPTLRLPDLPSERLRRILRGLKETIKSAVQCLDEALDEGAQSPSGPGAAQMEQCRVQRFAGMRLYGSEDRRQRRWHNFGPQELGGSLSPNKDTVRGALDRISHAETMLVHGEAFLVLAIMGDHFLMQQCRRLVGAILCIHHGWLPRDFLRTATRQDVVLNTPLAPGHLLYLGRCRFATWSRRYGGLFDPSWPERVRRGGSAGPPALPVFQDHGGEPVVATQELRQALHEHIAAVELGGGSSGTAGVGTRGVSSHVVENAPRCGGDMQPLAAWLEHARVDVAPRIRAQLEAVAQVDAFAEGRCGASLLQCPLPPAVGPSVPAGLEEAYSEVLRLLRELRDSGRWPSTSPARARVLRAGDGGTFSFGRQLAGQRAPKLAAELPELAAAVFALERAVAPPGRPASTWVAVNRNALFAPHIDAGAGLGQSKSLIVGLGSYVGGELVIEGQAMDIRYRPLEFDGWRQRHWTLPYKGERFSLVWFTPA